MQTELNPPLENGQKEVFLLKKGIFLIKFGSLNYVPLQDIKSNLLFLTLQHKVKPNGIAKYSDKFISEGPTYKQGLWLSVNNLHPAFNPKHGNEKVSLMRLKKFEKYANSKEKENFLKHSRETLEK